MKRFAVFVFVLVCAVCLVSCSSDQVDKTKPVFETENIARITFYTLPGDVTVYPGHGCSTNIADEKKLNPYI